MSDEAFARRFYSDRAELLALGVPLHSQRDEFTGEELYTLRSRAVLPAAARARRTTSSRRSRPRSTCSRGSSPTPSRCGSRCRTSRSAGRGSSRRRPTENAVRVELARPRLLRRDVRAAREARERDLEAADDQVPLLDDHPRRGGRAHGQPVRAPPRAGLLVPRRPRPRPRGHPHLPGVAHPRRHPLRDEARARLPHRRRTSTRRRYPRPARPGSSASPAARPRSRSPRTRPGGSSARSAPTDASRTTSFRHGVRDLGRSPRGSCARTGARRRSRRASSSDEIGPGAPQGRERPRRRRRRASPRPPSRASRRAAGRAARRPGRAGALRRAPGAARLPARALRRRHPRRRSPRTSCVERFHLTEEQLQEHLALLNLVNFGGGCYAVYAELQGDDGPRRQGALRRHVPPAPRLTPLEARAIRLALEFVGPMIAAEAHTPLETRAAQARGDLRRVRALRAASRSRTSAPRRRTSSARLAEAIRDAAARRDRVPEGGRGAVDEAVVEPYALERELPELVRAHAGTARATRERSFRLDRMRARQADGASASSARPELRARTSSATSRTRPRSSTRPAVARWQVERGARRSPTARRSRSAPSAARSGSSARSSAYRGEAVVVEPAELRARVAARARKSWRSELGRHAHARRAR